MTKQQIVFPCSEVNPEPARPPESPGSCRCLPGAARGRREALAPVPDLMSLLPPALLPLLVRFVYLMNN